MKTIADFEREEINPAGFGWFRTNGRQRWYTHRETGDLFVFGCDDERGRLETWRLEDARRQLRKACEIVARKLQEKHMAETKTCIRCGERKPLADFSRNSAAAGGRGSYCKSCDNARQAQWRARKKAMRQDIQGQPASPTAIIRAAQDQAAEDGAAPALDALRLVTADTPLATARELANPYIEDGDTAGAYDEDYPAPNGGNAPVARQDGQETASGYEGLVMEVSDSLADFLALSEMPSAFVHPSFVVAVVPDQERKPAFWVLAADQSGPRAVVPSELVAYLVGLLAHESAPDAIIGRMYY